MLPKTPLPITVRFPPARPFLRLEGSFVGTTLSAIRRRHTDRLTLRLRTSAPVTVELWRRAISRWRIETYVGQDVQHRVPRFVGEDVRLIVQGEASGVVELVEEGP